METPRKLDAEKYYEGDVRGFKKLNRQERDLMLQSVSDVDGRNRFAEHNLRLVFLIVGQYWNHLKYRAGNLEFLDLVQEGNIGLLTAIQRFDPRHGCQFSTYALWWIRQRVLNALITQAKTISLTNYSLEHVLDYERAWMELQLKLQRTPTDEEVASVMEISTEKVRRIQLDHRLISVESLDDQLTTEDHGTNPTTVGDATPDTQASNPLELLLAEEVVSERFLKREKILRYLATHMSPRDVEIYQLRHPVHPEDAPTLEEVGRRFDISRERVRQITEKASALAARYLQR